MASGYNCGDCAWLDFNDQNRWGEYWCPQKRTYYRADSRSCSNDFVKSSRLPGGACYLTTAMVDVLELPDDTFCLEVLRKYRDTYLINTEDGPAILNDYDTVGSIISERIKNDENCFGIATTMYHQYISPAVQNILQGNNETALEIYENMTLDLMDHYEIERSKLKAKDYEQKGIARVRKPIIKNEKDN